MLTRLHLGFWKIFVVLDIKTKGTKRFHYAKAQGCSVPSAVRALLRA